MKFLFIDTEQNTSEVMEDLQEFLENWNDEMDTDYETAEDFNAGEEYYQIKETTIKEQILWFDEDGVLICNSNPENEAETKERILNANFIIADHYVEDFGKLIQIVADLQDNSTDPFWDYKQLWEENHEDALGRHWTTPTGAYIPFFTGSQKEAISSIYWHIMNLLGLQRQAHQQWMNA